MAGNIFKQNVYRSQTTSKPQENTRFYVDGPETQNTQELVWMTPEKLRFDHFFWMNWKLEYCEKNWFDWMCPSLDLMNDFSIGLRILHRSPKNIVFLFIGFGGHSIKAFFFPNYVFLHVFRAWIKVLFLVLKMWSKHLCTERQKLFFRSYFGFGKVSSGSQFEKLQDVYRASILKYVNEVE